MLPPIRVTQTLVFIGLASNFNTHTKVSNLQTSLDSKIYPSNIPFLYSNKMYSTLESKKSKSDLKSKPLDSQSLIPQLFNPKFLDSILKSKFHSNLKALIFNQLIPKLLTLQEYFKFTFFNINKFIINICYNIFNFIKVNIFIAKRLT